MHQEQAEGHDRREAFLAALQDGRSVTGAAKAAGINRTLLYRWRSDMPEFAAAWDETVETALDLIEEEAWQRARHGVQKPVFYRGQQIGTITTWNDKLLMFLLQRRRPMPPPARVQAAAASAAREAPVPDVVEPDEVSEAAPVMPPADREAPDLAPAAPPREPADSAPRATKRRPPWPGDLPDEWRDLPRSRLARMTTLTSAQALTINTRPPNMPVRVSGCLFRHPGRSKGPPATLHA